MANATSGGYRRDNRVLSLDEEGSLDLRTRTDAIAYSFSADSRRLVISDAAGMIQRWDMEQRAEVELFSAHVGAAHSVHWLPDDRIVSASGDGSVKVWQSRRSGVVQLKGYPDSLRTLAFTPDSRWLVAAGVDREVFVWEVAGDSMQPPAARYTNHQVHASALAVSPSGLVATADSDRIVRMWNPGTRETVWASSLAATWWPYWIACSPDGRRIYALSHRETLTVLDAATGAPLNSISGLEHGLDGLAVSPDGRLVAVCEKGANLSVRRADDVQELWRVPARPDRCAAFSPDGQWIATGDTDGVVSLWEVASAERVRRTLRGHAATVKGVSFHPNGSRLISCGFDAQVKVWDWRGGVELLSLPVRGVCSGTQSSVLMGG